jgi:hypothetical protein
MVETSLYDGIKTTSQLKFLNYVPGVKGNVGKSIQRWIN